MDLENQVIIFFKKKYDFKTIDKSTNIASPKFEIFDLDAEHIMVHFFTEFKIDYSGFIIDQYFQYPDFSWRDLIFVRFFKKREYSKKPPLTIRHLVKVAEKGEWFDPDNLD